MPSLFHPPIPASVAIPRRLRRRGFCLQLVGNFPQAGEHFLLCLPPILSFACPARISPATVAIPRRLRRRGFCRNLGVNFPQGCAGSARFPSSPSPVPPGSRASAQAAAPCRCSQGCGGLGEEAVGFFDA
jgi:hypothetical protein